MANIGELGDHDLDVIMSSFFHLSFFRLPGRRSTLQEPSDPSRMQIADLSSSLFVVFSPLKKTTKSELLDASVPTSKNLLPLHHRPDSPFVQPLSDIPTSPYAIIHIKAQEPAQAVLCVFSVLEHNLRRSTP
jgi:hypothetical protein